MTTVWREGTAYLQVRLHGGWQLRIVKATQKQPAVIEADCVVVKVRIRIPQRAFAPLQPRCGGPSRCRRSWCSIPVEVEAVAP